MSHGAISKSLNRKHAGMACSAKVEREWSALFGILDPSLVPKSNLSVADCYSCTIPFIQAKEELERKLHSLSYTSPTVGPVELYGLVKYVRTL